MGNIEDSCVRWQKSLQGSRQNKVALLNDNSTFSLPIVKIHTILDDFGQLIMKGNRKVWKEGYQYQVDLH